MTQQLLACGADIVEINTIRKRLSAVKGGRFAMHCAPASGGTPVTELAQAFLVPKHTLVKLNAAIWHLAPLPAQADELAAMIILPECTYANDCTVVDLTPEQQFEIVR